MSSDKPAPRIVVLAGPNGAGKSTSASRILRGALRVDEFVNADTIAQGLSGFAPERMAMAAGRIMLRRLNELAANRKDFAFETTLASRTFAPWLAERARSGYRVHLVFLWLPSADAAVARVAERVRRGGHGLPETTIRRRYAAGVRNFFDLYRPLAASWEMLHNGGWRPRLVAHGVADSVRQVRLPRVWNRIIQEGGHAT